MRTRTRLVNTTIWLLLSSILLASCADKNVPATALPTLTPFPPDSYIGLSDSASALADLVSTAYEADRGFPAPQFILASDETLLNDLEDGSLEAILIHYLPEDSDLWFSPVALDGVVFLIHPGLAIESLDAGQIRAIFSGTIANWTDVGGADLPVRLFSREPGSGAWAILQERVMQDTLLDDLAQIAPTDEFMRQQVASTPGAIGYGMMGSANDALTTLYEGYAATPDTVSEQRYPLTAPIYFVAQAEPEGRARDFLAWLQSPAGQRNISEKYGHVR